MHLFYRLLILSLCTMSYLVLASNGLGQIAREQHPVPANEWMKKASPPLEEADTIAPVVRYDRDTFFDDTIGSPEPLTPGTASRSHMSEGSVYGEVPEIPPLNANSLIITGRFESYRSILSASHRSVYTDIHVSVQRIVYQGSEIHVTPGADITIDVGGGTVDLGDGRVLSYLTDPREYALQPSRDYLLVLTHVPSGDFFTVDRNWDITDAIVKPNTWHEAILAKKGRSRLSGLSVEAAISEVKKQLPGQ